MSYGSHVWPPQLLGPIYERVADSVAGLTRDRVFSSLWDEDDHLKWPPADRFVTGLMANFPVDQRDVSGGGNYNTAFDAVTVLTAYVRLDADIENRSTQQLTDEVNGVYTFCQDIIACLQTWDGPVMSDDLRAFRRPMRIAPGWQIRKKSAGAKARWAVAPMSFETSFVANLGFAFDGSVIPLRP